MVSHALPTAVIGAGDWGKNIVRKFHECEALAAVAETNTEKANQIQSDYNVPIRTFDEIIHDDQIKAIALTSPAITHYELALQVIEQGKHLFIEKPITLNHQEAEDLTAKARAKNITLMAGHLLHYHPCFAKLKELVADGELGAVRHIHSRRFNIGKFREEENVLWDLGPHDVSMVLALAGNAPITIEGKAANYLLPNVSDFASIYLTFPGNINAEINLSWLAPQKEHRLIIIGEKAMAVFDDTLEWDNKLRIHRHKAEMKPGKPPILERDMEGEAVPVPYKEPLLNECETFLNAITSNTPPYSTGEEASNVIKVLEAADPAIKAQQTLSKTG